jgi:deazaflavin-dependent oxidoreductase (nitroreductase family)
VASSTDPIIAEFRANRGRVGGVFGGADLLLLTTRGAGSGRPVTKPVGYVRDGLRLLVFGSDHRQEQRPGWYHNLVVHPSVTVEVGTDDGIETFPAHAVPLEDGECDHVLHGRPEGVPVVALYPTRGAAGRVAALGDHLVRVHDYFRALIATARQGGEAGVDLREHCLTMCAALHEHHTREDGFFPGLQELVPGLAPVLDRLRAEHVVVAEHIRELRALLDGPRGADFEERLDRLVAEVEAHFAYEERTLVPVLNMSAT